MTTSQDGSETGLVHRLLRAVELLAAAHAQRARDEAGRDLARLASGLILGVIALMLVLPILLLVDVALVLVIREATLWPWYTAALAVAGGNTALAAATAWMARRRLAPPLLAETRATLRRALVVVRGS